LLCNEISPTCLKILNDLGIPNISFDIDNENAPFPFKDGRFDAVISLVTIEHLMHPDHFLNECNRILVDDGYFYINTPNYASLNYVLGLIFNGKSFHNPLSKDSAYEFYAHVRYFTYRTLLEMVSAAGFILDKIYIALPELNADYLALKSHSKIKAFTYRYSRWFMYHLLHPRWTAEPILCFQKAGARPGHKIQKMVL
jgi:SAM-dependent methyltransferase